jgi:hypothetical protein
VSFTQPVSPKSSQRGRDQKIARRPTCRVAVWSDYPQAGLAVRFVRVGTMDNPDLCPHFFTSSKQSWLTLPAGARAVPVYDLSAVWRGRAFERHRLMPANVVNPSGACL